MKTRLLCLLISLTCLSGCVTAFNLVPVTSGTVDSFWVNGRQAGLMTDEQATVAVCGWKNAQNQLAFHVFVQNTGDRSVDVLTADIRVAYKDVYGERRGLFVEDPHKYLLRIEKQRQAAQVALAISGALNSFNAGYSSSTTTAQAYGSGGGYAYGQANTTSYSSLAAATERAMHAQTARRVDEQYVDRYDSAATSLLYSQTLAGGGETEGIVLAEYRVGDMYAIKVVVGDESYWMRFLPGE